MFEEEVHEYGYHTYWSVLNAKHYGIPQNRERVYLILIQERREMGNGKFQFAEPSGCFQCLMDILEVPVEEFFLIPGKSHLIEDMEERKALLLSRMKKA